MRIWILILGFKGLRLEHIPWQVAATSHSDRSLFVYRSGDLLRQHVVVTMAGTYYFMCAGEFLENLCLFNIILFPHQVTQILCDLNFFDMLQGPKFFCGDKDFHKNSPVHLKWFVAATCHLGSVPIFRVNCAFCTFFPWAIGCAKVGKIPSCQLYLITITDILTAWLCQDSKWIVHCKLVVWRIILVIAWLGNVELGVIGPLQVC